MAAVWHAKGGPDAGGAVATGGGDAGGMAAAPTPVPATAIRFADLAPDAPAAGYDICTSPPGDLTWTGPVLGGGIAFAQVGKYVAMATASNDIRVVAPGSTDCSNPVATGIGLPALSANQHITYALIGYITPTGQDPAASLVAFVDETTAAAGQAALRFVNASPAAAAVDFGIDQGGNFAPIAQDVLFGSAASTLVDGGIADTNGYLLSAPLVMATLDARPLGDMMSLVSAANVSLSGGTVNSIFAINGGTNNAAVQLLVCQDNTPTQGMRSACMIQ
jgi:Domain of unknown function (DUF4397)